MNYTFAECFWVRDHVTEINLSCTDLQPHPVGYGEACFRISFDIVHWLTNSVYCPLLGGTMQGPDDNDYCCVDEGTTITFQEDSLHNLEFYCVDALKNRNNETDLEYFRVDSQPPIINKTLIGPQVGTCPPRPGTNDTCWIKDWAYENGTTIHIEAYDNNTYENCTVGNVTCDWHYYLDGSYRIGGTDMPPSFDIRFSEDTVHELHITCRDALGNEETDVETFYVDSQPPNTIKWYVGPQVPDEGYPKWINSKTEVHLNATDAPNAPCAVGVNKTYWRNTLVDDINCWEEHECQMHAMGDGIWTEYLLPFHKPDQSCHLIEYFSVDLLGNEEGVKKQCVFVDNTPPEWNKTIGNPFMETGEQVEICENVSSSGDCAYYDSGSSYSNKSNTSVVIDITNINNGSQTCCDSMCVEGAASAIGGSGSLDVIFVMDTSGSMSWNDPNESRKDGAKNLIDILPEGSQVAIAVIDFDNYANIIQDFTFNHTEAKEAIDTLDASGGTNIGNAVDLANEHLINNGRSGSAWVEILFTDGSGSYSPQYTTNAANAGIVIHTMGLGSGVNETLLKEIANGTGGTYTYVDDPANLSVAFPGLTLTNIIKVTVNNNVATLYPDGSFIYCSVDLAVGDNTITAIATATDNATGYDEVVLTRLLQDQCNQTNGTVCHNETVIHVSNKTQINLTCTDRDRHPVGKESVCFKVSYDYPDWGYITDAYCNYYSGTLNAENYCCIYTGGASFVFQFREETMHNLEFYCVDGLNNEGTEDIEYFKVDSIAPTTTQSYHGAYYLNETTNATYIDTASWINLSAVDGGGVCTIGVNETYWQNMIVDDYYCNTPANCAQWDPTNLDSEKWNTYTGSIYKENESCHILAYYSVDKLENDENVQWQCFFVDKKPPITEKTYIGPFFEEGGIKWITSSTNVTLFAYDPEPHPSGVNRTYYKDIYLNDSDDWHYCYNNCSGWTQDARYGLPTAPEPYNPTGYKYTGLEESCHIIEYYSVDNVNKTETLNYQCVFVDNTAPVPDKKVGKPSSYCDNTSGNCTWEWKVTTMTPITLSCDDQGPHPSDHSIVHWRVWWDRTQNWTEWNTTVEGTEIYLEEECLHQLEFYCTDAVGHESEKDLEWIKVKGGAFNITLNPKWNLISVPFVMTENSIEKVFEDIAGKVISVWTYDGEADEWYVYTPGPGTDTLTEMKPGWGYWVLMNTSAMEGNPVQLTIGGSLFSEAATPPSKKVVPGWNLIGYYGTSGELGYNGPVGNGDCAYCTLYSLVDTVFGTERWSSLVTYWGPDSPSWKYLGLYDEMDAGAGYWMEIDVEDTYSFSTSCGFCGP
ncbi:MAG: hypothetical protein DRN66_03880 [Candidatus Nanohalarchaeota archaeon]|nr:MAG: hypothetical protein DRN66_03880 [Candidatus Nanohaloarchaeota archaeon]